MDAKTYFRNLVEIDPTEIPFGRVIRDFWKGILDFIRNLVVIAFLKFVSVKTGGIIVWVLYEISTAALAAYLIAFLSLSFNVFAPVKNPIRRNRLNHLTYMVVVLALYWAIRMVINVAVAEIAKGQLP